MSTLDRLNFTRKSLRRTDDTKLRPQLEEIAFRALDGNRGRGWAREIGPIEDRYISQEKGYVFSSWIRFYRTHPIDPEREESQRKIIYEFALAAGHHSRYGSNPWIGEIPKEPLVKTELFDPGLGIPGQAEESLNVPSDDLDDQYDYTPLASIKHPIKPGEWYSHLFDLDAQIKVLLSSIQAAIDSKMENRFHALLWGDPGCLSGDTIIKYQKISPDGRKQNSKGGTLRTLYKSFNRVPGGKGHYVRSQSVNSHYCIASCDESTGKILMNTVIDVIDSGVKTVYSVCTKSGRGIKATADHQFLTPNGYVPLSSLRCGDSILMNPMRVKNQGGKNPKYRSSILVKQHSANREKFVGGKYRYCRIKTHQAVYEAHVNNMSFNDYVSLLNKCTKEEARELWSIPSGFEIHHKNENPNDNNSISNLELVASSSSHQRMYHKESATEGVTLYAETEIIASIVDCGKEDVYDIVMAEPYRNFSAEGFIVHNCGKSDIILSTGRLLRNLGVNYASFDAASMTEAGVRKILLDEDELVPDVILLEEVDKVVSDNSLRWLLGVMDHRGVLSQTNFRKTATRQVQALVLATANDYDAVKKMVGGALLSRFGSEIYCPHASRETLAKILERDLKKLPHYDLAWIEPTLQFCVDEQGITDPRKLQRVCLCGKESLLDGSYQESLRRTTKANGQGKISPGTVNLNLY